MSTSPTKETSPVKADKALFTDKEERVLKAAWHCLKSPPEIDIEKLRIAAEFNTTKTAANTWGVIKKKLASLAPPAAEGEDAPSTPSKTKATPKKRGKKATVEDAAEDDDEGESPTKKRKTPKKSKVKAGQEEEETAVKEETGEADPLA